MKCDRVTKSAHCGAFTEQVDLSVVEDDSEENKTWSKYTPSGSVTLEITNERAHGAFVPGREYLLTFEPCSKE